MGGGYEPRAGPSTALLLMQILTIVSAAVTGWQYDTD